MNDPKEFASSSNGDKWFVGNDDASGALFVLHRGNTPSGGHETRSSVDAFLSHRPFGPEREALLTFMEREKKGKKGNTAEDIGLSDDGLTPSLRLAEEYLRLGGRRRAKVDDNIVSTRLWEDEPAMASAFWRAKIEPLDQNQRREVELHLPSVSDT